LVRKIPASLRDVKGSAASETSEQAFITAHQKPTITSTNLKIIYNKIMLNDLQKKYLELTKFGPYPSPYFFHIRKGGQIMYYLGFDHTYDAKDLSWGVLDNYMQDFIDKTDGKKRMVLVEGGEKILASGRRDQIKAMGEAYYTWYLAQSSAIPVIYPEPSINDQLKFLSEKFPKDVIITSIFVEQLCIRSNYIKPDNIESSLLSYLDYVKNAVKWEGGVFDIKNIFECYKKISGIELDYNNLEYIRKETDPYLEINTINEVINTKSQFKDKITVKNTKDLWDKGYNILAVFGKSHAIMHEISIKEW